MTENASQTNKKEQEVKPQAKQTTTSNKYNALRRVGIKRGDILGEFIATEEELKNDESLKQAIKSGYIVKI